MLGTGTMNTICISSFSSYHDSIKWVLVFSFYKKETKAN